MKDFWLVLMKTKMEKLIYMENENLKWFLFWNTFADYFSVFQNNNPKTTWTDIKHLTVLLLMELEMECF